jgi:hypothetical protein
VLRIGLGANSQQPSFRSLSYVLKGFYRKKSGPRTPRPPSGPPFLGMLAWSAGGLPSTQNWSFRWPLPLTSPPQVIPKAMRAASTSAAMRSRDELGSVYSHDDALRLIHSDEGAFRDGLDEIKRSFLLFVSLVLAVVVVFGRRVAPAPWRLAFEALVSWMLLGVGGSPSSPCPRFKKLNALES